MFRRLIIMLVAVCLLGSVAAGCGSSSSKSSSQSSSQSSSSNGSAGGGTKSVHLAKTKFVLHAGLAFGAFHRYVYKPFRSGAFSGGKKVRTYLKAGLAGLFAYHEIKKARDAAQGSPLLSRLLQPLTALQASLLALGTKLKGGHAAPADIQSANGSANSVSQLAGQSGAPIKELPTPSLGG